MVPVKKNNTYNLEITSVSSDGNGVGHIDGFTVFVPQTVDGDVIECLIVKVRSSFAYGKAMKIIKSSPHRKEAECSAYKRCGGCQLMHIDYERQKQIKLDIVNGALKRIGGFTDFEADGIDALENPYRYRNKMVFPVGYDKNGKTVCGFYAQRSHDIMPLDDCFSGSDKNGAVIKAVLDYMKKYNVSAYDEESHNGTVRRIFMRSAHKTGEVMAVISINADDLPHKDELVKALLEADKNIASVILNINKKKTNLVLGDKNVTVYGKDSIEDVLMGISFEISPHSFYQINPVMTERLYQKALEYASLSGNERVMDIYCGIGTISLCAAKKASEVIGVEIVEAAIENAKDNAKRNGIENARFYADSAENIVPKLIENGERPDVVILDPPRKGSDEKTLDAIIKAQPKRVVYVSCNPSTLARDLKYMAQNGYTPIKAHCYDLFPHTVHVETVVLLSKLYPDDRIEVDLDLDELDITAAESKATYEEIKAYIRNKYGFKVSSLYIAQTKTKCGIIERINYNISKKGTRVPQCPPDKENAIKDALKHFGMIGQ